MQKKLRDGTLLEQDSSQDRVLSFLYGNAFGRFLLKPLTARWLSRAAGWVLSTGFSKVFIRSFVKNNHIDLTQFEPVSYGSYNEFFSRRIKPELRPVDPDPNHLVSPCDSKLTVLPITEDCVFSLKHTPYTVESLLQNPQLAEAYRGGYVLIFRLTVDDYHRYSYPVDGTKDIQTRIPGKFHTVNPIANDFYPIYKENTREYTVLHNAVFGDLVMMEVGALLVGKIVNHHEEAEITRGQEKGYFQFGGSTVVVLLKPNAAALDADILENSAAGIETVIKMGEKIGTAL